MDHICKLIITMPNFEVICDKFNVMATILPAVLINFTT